MVLATAQGRTEAREGADFFPLTIDVEERMYAAGKIPGGFFKREGRPTERAILTARMIDRPIRPLWPKGFRNEVQVICTVLSRGHGHTARHPLHQRRLGRADALAAAVPRPGRARSASGGSTASSSSTRRCRRTRTTPTLDLIVVGTKDGLTMVEAGADEVPEERLLEALELAHGEIVKLCEAQEELRRAGRQAEVARPRAHRRDRAGPRPRDLGAHPEVGLREAAAIVDELLAELAPAISMDSTDEDIKRQMQVKSALTSLLEKQRSVAVEGPVREQFDDELRALTDAEQDSKELKSAKRQLLFDRIVEDVELPFPVGAAQRPRDRRGAAGGEGLA